MNRNTIKGLGPLTAFIAVWLIAVDSSLLRGQRDGSEMVFEAPVPVGTEPVSGQRIPQPLPTLAQRTNSTTGFAPQKKAVTSPSGVTQAGGTVKTGVTQTGYGTAPRTPSTGRNATGITQVGGTLSSPRTAIPGTEPKRMIPATTTSAAPITTVPLAPPGVTSNSSIPSTQSGRVVPVQATAGAGSGVTTAGNHDPLQVVTPDGMDTALRRNRREPAFQPIQMTPTDRGMQPPFRGSIMGLNFGETPVERLIQTQTAMREMEQQNEELRQLNAGLQNRIKEREEQMLAAVREIKVARKELALAKNDLERSKKELQNLHDRVRTAEREHAAVLRSMGPLLQQLLESDDVSSTPPNSAE